MTALQVLDGGGETTATPECQICGVAHHRPCAVLARHLQHLRRRGLAATSVENRQCAIRRLAAVLPVPVVDADAGMLTEWRAGLRDTRHGRTAANYCGYIAEFYRWAQSEGYLEDDPAAGLKRRPGRPPSTGQLPPEMHRHLDWLRQRGHSATTIYGRGRALARLTYALPVPVLDATQAHLATWRAGLAVTPEAIVHEVCHADQFYRWAVKQGLRAGNPAADLPVPKMRRRLPRPISEEQLMHAIACAPPRIRIWLVLAAWCGMRAIEVALIRRENIRETDSPPVLLIAADATKGISERCVPLSSFVVAELAAAGLPSRGYAFRRMDGRGGPNSPGRVSHLANDHLRSCGIRDTYHSLRHRFGTGTWKATKDLRLVMDLMGHADPRTAALYTMTDKSEAAAAVEALPVPRLKVVK